MTKKTLCDVERMLRRYPALRNRRSRRLRLWREAIDDTLAEYEQTGEEGKAGLLMRHYFEGFPEGETLKALHISRRTYYSYKHDALCTAAFYAAKRGLL